MISSRFFGDPRPGPALDPGERLVASADASLVLSGPLDLAVGTVAITDRHVRFDGTRERPYAAALHGGISANGAEVSRKAALHAVRSVTPSRGLLGDAALEVSFATGETWRLVLDGRAMDAVARALGR